MSFLNTIITTEHTFAAWAEKELALVLKDAPTVLLVADTTLTYCAPLLSIVVTKEAGSAAGAEVTSVCNEAIADLTAIRGVLADAGPNPTAAALLASVNDNLAGLLTAGHITDAVSVSLVKKVIAEIVALTAALTPAVTK